MGTIQFYGVYQGFRLNIGERREMIIIRLRLTTFEMSNIFGAVGVVVQVDSSLKSNHPIKISLSKSPIHTVSVQVASSVNNDHYKNKTFRVFLLSKT